MVRIGVIGYGYWGPNLVRNFSECPETRVVGVCDFRQDRLDLAGRRYPGIKTTRNAVELIRDPAIDAIAISTPVSTHFDLALQVLQSGKHVLVEKPITRTSDEGLRLIDEANRRKLVLMVDHTFVYTGAIRKIRELIEAGSLGDIYYYDSTRINLGLFQQDVDVIWDLAVHDLSIMEYILPGLPKEVSATGIGHVNGATENIAYVTVFYDNALIAHLNVNWLSPIKIRRTLIGGSKRMILYDDIESSEKVKVYDKGVIVKNGPESLYKLLVAYRSGDMYAPQLDVSEALRVEVKHFAECIVNNKIPITDGYAGVRVVRILEAATNSMKQHGRTVRLEQPEYCLSAAACARPAVCAASTICTAPN